MRLAAAIAMAASVACAQLNFNEPGLVWAGLYPGYSVSNAVHNVARTGVVGNTRGPIQDMNRGIASNSTATAAWVGLGTNAYPLQAASEFTLSMWIKAGGALGATLLMGNAFSTGTTGTFYFSTASGTRLSCYAQSLATNYVGYDKSSLPNILTSNWVHLATTWTSSRTNMQLFINGEGMTVATTRVGANITSLQPCDNEARLGTYANGANSFLVSGRSIAMARIYNRSLSTNEVRSLYMRERAFLP